MKIKALNAFYRRTSNFSYCIICMMTFNSGYMLAQFHGPAGTINSNAIHKDSLLIINWAKTCVVERGYQDISNTSSGYADTGIDSNATGKAGTKPVVSLGDGGTATLSFWPPIKNGPGYDFAVFENAFSDSFLELAFVEVSSDGINFFRFPPTSNAQHSIQIGTFDAVGEADKINNLAGKYRVNYGTPFDLEELKDVVGLNIHAITHVKVIDVVGCIQIPYARYDQNNKPINDPWPTPFGNGGFDLDAVGVINEQETGLTTNLMETYLTFYPNPAKEYLLVHGSELNDELLISGLSGKTMVCIKITKPNEPVHLNGLTSGIYLIKLKRQGFVKNAKLIIQH